MAEIKIFTDTSSDMPLEFYAKHDVGIIPYYTTFDKVTYLKEHVELSPADFYARLKAENVIPSTSMPTVPDFTEAFRPYLEKGMDIFHVNMSSLFSGSYQCAVSAARELKEEFPGREVYIMDSIQAAGGQGLTLYQAIKMREAGFALPEIIARMEEIKHTSRVFLTIDQLKFLQKGGRIGKVTAFGGMLLQIKPIIVMRQGELNPDGKVRGRQKAIDKVFEITMEHVRDGAGNYDFAVVHSDCAEEAEALQKRLKDAGCSCEFPILLLGVTIGSHTGPTLLGIAVIRKYDKK
ncbi:MAG: DegV family protein [Defluviitaleaceae bacterium]|nr:DegV family protein [Defluviitaleaceae bacterium]